MFKALNEILEIQECDMKMIQLLDVRHQREEELKNIKKNESSLINRVNEKESDILEMKKVIGEMEAEHAEILAKIKKLEAHQSSIKKVDEYNAITHELSTTDRERLTKEQRLSDFYDRLTAEEDNLKVLKENLESAIEGSKAHEDEIEENIRLINAEGRAIKAERDELVARANPDVFKIYERLLRNKRDRVVVPLENRCCSGCHIMLTAQHENLVRRGERLIFCEHCSRIHFWQENKALEDALVPTKQRRRKAKV